MSICYCSVRKLVCLLLFLTPFIYTNAQHNVCLASNGGNAHSMTPSAPPTGETANDIWVNDHVNFKVIVHEGTVRWWFSDALTTVTNAGSSRILPSTGPVWSPDVAIVADYTVNGPNIYALIVYYNPEDKNYYYNQRKINTTTGDLEDEFATVLEDSHDAPKDNGIRIDANLMGEFVIVLDDRDEDLSDFMNPIYSMCKSVLGYVDQGNGPVLCGSVTPLYRSRNSIWPDVAISAQDGSGNGKIFYTWMNGPFDGNTVSHTLVVEEMEYVAHCAGGAFPITTNIMKKDCHPSHDHLTRSRIAAPASLDLGVDEWTVVWKMYDGTNGIANIKGVSSTGNVQYEHNYTNNSEPELLNAGISVSQNEWHDHPCVSYGFRSIDDGNVAQVAWFGGFKEDRPTGTKSKTVIGISIDNYGYISDACAPACYKLASTTFDAIVHPSLAGKHANSLDFNLCWWNTVSRRLGEKNFQWCDDSYRNGNPVEASLPVITKKPGVMVYPNPSEGGVKMELQSLDQKNTYTMIVTDINGRKLAAITGKPGDLKYSGSDAIAKLRAGMYRISIYYQNQVVATDKVIRL